MRRCSKKCQSHRLSPPGTPDGIFGNATDTQLHNDANEQTLRTDISPRGAPITAGNVLFGYTLMGARAVAARLTGPVILHTYTHDDWGHLAQIKNTVNGAHNPRADDDGPTALGVAHEKEPKALAARLQR